MLRRIFLLVVLSSALVSCAVRLVSPYDAKIDEGISEFQVAYIAFSKKLYANAGKPAGDYKSNATFYSTWDTKLDALTQRAIAADPIGTCGLTKEFDQAVAAQIGSLLDEARKKQLAEFNKDLEGGCTAQLVAMLRAQLADYAAFHKAQPQNIGITQRIGRPADTLMRISIRAVLQHELAKKSGAT